MKLMRSIMPRLLRAFGAGKGDVKSHPKRITCMRFHVLSLGRLSWLYRHARPQSRPAAPSHETPVEEDAQPPMLSVSPSAESVRPRNQEPGRLEPPSLEETLLPIGQVDEQAVEPGEMQESGRGDDGHAQVDAELPAFEAAELRVPSESTGVHEVLAVSDGSMLQQPDSLGEGGSPDALPGMVPDIMDDMNAETGPAGIDSPSKSRPPSSASQQSAHAGPVHLAPILSGGSLSSIGTAVSSDKGSAPATALPAMSSNPVLPVAPPISLAKPEILNGAASFASDTDSEISDTDISDDDSDDPITPSLSLRPGTALRPVPLLGAGSAGTALKPAMLHGSGPSGIAVKPVTLLSPLKDPKPALALRVGPPQNGLHPGMAGSEPSSPMMGVPAQHKQHANAKQLAAQPKKPHPGYGEAINVGTTSREDHAAGVIVHAAGRITTSLKTAGAPLPAPSPGQPNSGTQVRPSTPLHIAFQCSANGGRACLGSSSGSM